MGRLRGELKSSQDRCWGVHTIERDGDPYMTRYWIGKLRMHVFHRGDHDQDCHDHPWDFWTFPLTGYVEEVLHQHRDTYVAKDTPPPPRFFRTTEVVKPFRLHFRPAEHCHRVLGAWGDKYEHKLDIGTYYSDSPKPGAVRDRPSVDYKKKVITVVWQAGVRRKWGFWKERSGRWCWQYWKDYVLAGGKNAPCE